MLDNVATTSPEINMNVSIADAVAKYKRVREEVRARCPATWDEVGKLCRAVPRTIDQSVFWSHGRDKPCWSNITVAIGGRIASDLDRSPAFESFHTIADQTWELALLERGPRWKANTNFEIRGPAARSFVEGLPRGGLSSYLWRLFAIRGLATSLCRDDGVRQMIDGLVQKGGKLAADDVEAWSVEFARRAGMGWGYTTVNHMLTDLGLAVKNDLHLRRTVIRMGLFPGLPSDIGDDEIKRLAPKIDHEIVRIVIGLAGHIEPTANPAASSSLREMDKVLMEWSKQGLARPLGLIPDLKVIPILAAAATGDCELES
jgi:hypothetical protein